MFIDTGGLPEQHKPHSGGKLHLQPQRHHHGHRHLQQFSQLHHPYRSRRLAARRHLLLRDPRHHGSLCPAALLLKPGPPQPPLLLCLNTPRLPSNYPTQSSLTPLPFTAQRPQDTHGGTPQPSLSSLINDLKKKKM